MNYADIVYYDTGNSHGISTTLFVSGCDMRCPKCHNPQAQDYNFGKVFTEKEEKEIINSLKNPHISYFVLTGGQPSVDKNKEVCLQLCKKIKNEVPRIKIILYTGHKVLDIDHRFYDYCDYIIDGAYIQYKSTLTLDLRGSMNQNCWEVIRTVSRDKNKEDKDIADRVVFLNKNNNYFRTSNEFSIDKEDALLYIIVGDGIEEEYYKDTKDYKIYLNYLKEIGDLDNIKD